MADEQIADEQIADHHVAADRTAVHHITVPGAGTVASSVDERGSGTPVLLLHGGGGSRTVAGFAGLLAGAGVRVLTPTHPGFDGTPRPSWLGSIADLARLYAALLDRLGLEGVTVVGNSIGGWIAAELGLVASPRVSGLVLADAVGIEVPGEPVLDVFPMTPDELARHSFADPDRFRLDPAAVPAEQRVAAAANLGVLRTYAGDMVDPDLRSRLAGLTVPTSVVWGAEDGVCTPAYGRAYAAAIPGASFTLVPRCGHLPQLERPEELLRVVTAVTARPQPALLASRSRTSA